MKITVVGGGTAGWMTAAYLSANLKATDEIVVIDKEVGTPIGVGEATILDFEPFMRSCGFSIEEWFSEVDATFKSGILFKNWAKDGEDIWHPFRHITPNHYCTQWDIWTLDQTTPFKTHALPMLRVSTENKVDLKNIQFYAYHVDCSKLILFIQQKLQGRIQIIRSAVKQIEKNNKDITSLTLENGDTHSSDLYIDCTGFISLLKEQVRVDVSDRLFCNTAVASHIQYQDKSKEFAPYAISESVEHGWIWKIPVQSRLGSGLVFNRNVTDIDTAKDFFVKHWDHRIDRDKVRVIDWTPYYIKNFWEGNIISIGLSGGFIEPLESTGLSLMRLGIESFTKIIKNGYVSEIQKDFYNSMMITTYDEVIDFVNMHYSNSKKVGPFWDHVRENYKKTERQQYYEQALNEPFRNFINYSGTSHDGKVFHNSNWFLFLIQLGHNVTPYTGHPASEYLNKEFLNNEFKQTLVSTAHLDAIKSLNLNNV